MEDRERDTPGLRICPLGLLMLAIFAGAVLGVVEPVRFVPDGLEFVVGPVLAGLGLVVLALAMSELRRADTPHRADEPTTKLVTDGPFGRSRNPIYLAMGLFGLGISILLDSAWLLGIMAVLMILIHFAAVLPEERYLERRFGEVYSTYKSTVRRWL